MRPALGLAMLASGLLLHAACLPDRASARSCVQQHQRTVDVAPVGRHGSRVVLPSCSGQVGALMSSSDRRLPLASPLSGVLPSCGGRGSAVSGRGGSGQGTLSSSSDGRYYLASLSLGGADLNLNLDKVGYHISKASRQYVPGSRLLAAVRNVRGQRALALWNVFCL